MPVLDYVLASDVGEESLDESCRVWLEKFATNEFREYRGRLPEDEIALTCVFSRNERQALKDLSRSDVKIQRQFEGEQQAKRTQ